MAMEFLKFRNKKKYLVNKSNHLTEKSKKIHSFLSLSKLLKKCVLKEKVFWLLTNPLVPLARDSK